MADGHNRFGVTLPNFEIRFVDKKGNASGMQLADLTARPIGLKVMRPSQSNRAFEIIESKLIRDRQVRNKIGRMRIFP